MKPKTLILLAGALTVVLLPRHMSGTPLGERIALAQDVQHSGRSSASSPAPGKLPFGLDLDEIERTAPMVKLPFGLSLSEVEQSARHGE